MKLTIAIPTYNRGAILADTLAQLLPLGADEIVIADQTRQHPLEVAAKLERWSAEGAIRWLRLPEPSIPHAMNEALVAATSELVLFLDDDLIPAANLVHAHRDAHSDGAIWAVVGQVLQPGESAGTFDDADDDLHFHFNGDRGRFIRNVMAGNLSVMRERALEIGGFDENFIGAAYRFETDFAKRIVNGGGKIWFEPRASIRHLQLSSGGLRSYGDHRTSPSPAHSAGDYYYALHHLPRFWPYALSRLRKNVLTRFHARRPWTIPAKVVGELRGLMLARKLWRNGRQLR